VAGRRRPRTEATWFALDSDAPDAVVVQAIRDAIDRAGRSAEASIEIEVKPYEDILADPAGIATSTRAESRSRRVDATSLLIPKRPLTG